MSTSGPTVARRRLGRRLQHLRESAGISVADVERAHLGSRQKVWRIEAGLQRVSVSDVIALCHLYNVDADELTALQGLALRTAERGLWYEYRDSVPDWFRLYVGLEAAATTITSWDDSVVPGELQTAAYVHALWSGARPDMTDLTIAPHIELRHRRQQALLERTPPVHLEVILGEGVLHRQVGGPDVLTEQITHLVELDRSDSISVRYVPFTAGAHPAVTGPFRILEFPDDLQPAVAYVELEVGAHYLERPCDLATYRRLAAGLSALSVAIGEFRT